MMELKNNTPPKIGWIGTGVMGASMAGHLLDAGYSLVVTNRTRSKADGLVEKGAVWTDSVAELAQQADLLFSIVGTPADVEEIYLGTNGILENANPGTVAVDMTTSSPELAERLFEAAASKDIQMLDAPVSGGDSGARAGTLSIMVGGESDAYQRLLPLFEVMGKNIVYQGKAGNGQRTKMANQIAVAGSMLGTCEALAYAEQSGLDPCTVLESIEKGAAGSWSLSNLGPRILNDDFAPGFFVKHFIKDLTIALESTENISTEFPGLRLSLQRYEELAAAGREEDGTQALAKLYKKKVKNSSGQT